MYDNHPATSLPDDPVARHPRDAPPHRERAVSPSHRPRRPFRTELAVRASTFGGFSCGRSPGRAGGSAAAPHRSRGPADGAVGGSAIELGVRFVALALAAEFPRARPAPARAVRQRRFSALALAAEFVPRASPCRWRSGSAARWCAPVRCPGGMTASVDTEALRGITFGGAMAAVSSSAGVAATAASGRSTVPTRPRFAVLALPGTPGLVARGCDGPPGEAGRRGAGISDSSERVSWRRRQSQDLRGSGREVRVAWLRGGRRPFRAWCGPPARRLRSASATPERLTGSGR